MTALARLLDTAAAHTVSPYRPLLAEALDVARASANAAEAWEGTAREGLLADTWIGDPRRTFLATMPRVDAPADRPRVELAAPDTRRACVTFASDSEGAAAAEALGREVAAALVDEGSATPTGIVWRCVEASDARPTEALLARVTAALARYPGGRERFDDLWRVASRPDAPERALLDLESASNVYRTSLWLWPLLVMAHEVPEPLRRSLLALRELTLGGYLLEDVSEHAIALLAPLPRVDLGAPSRGPFERDGLTTVARELPFGDEEDVRLVADALAGSTSGAWTRVEPAHERRELASLLERAPSDAALAWADEVLGWVGPARAVVATEHEGRRLALKGSRRAVLVSSAAFR